MSEGQKEQMKLAYGCVHLLIALFKVVNEAILKSAIQYIVGGLYQFSCAYVYYYVQLRIQDFIKIMPTCTVRNI